MPVYGPQDRVIPLEEAAKWVQKLLSMKPTPNAGQPTPSSSWRGAAETGPRSPDDVRPRSTPGWATCTSRSCFRNILNDPEATLSEEEESWVFGESLPVGLVLYQPEVDE
ncbi:MAG: hypothetical protein R2856_00830 [Caldilineaceae bacterium]